MRARFDSVRHAGRSIDLIRRACDVAACCHYGQFRRSGDPYVTHPLSVATILAGLGADDQILCAAILHDTVDDTPLILHRPVAHQRTIVALDIERSSSRPDPVKAEFRQTMYGLFDAALRAAGIQRRHRDGFGDRGDGFLALIHPADHVLETLLRRVIPAFGLLLADYNSFARRQHRSRWSSRPASADPSGSGRLAARSASRSLASSGWA